MDCTQSVLDFFVNNVLIAFFDSYIAFYMSDTTWQ